MQAPLQNGRKETLGRARGVKRTGRSLLLIILIIALVVVSGLTYTRERVEVERLLLQCSNLERQVQELRQSIDLLVHETASLERLSRIEVIAQQSLGMIPLDWKMVYVVEEREEKR
ncbi:MAG: hypothetical protein ACUVUU_05975 [bacterium]